jgi:protein ImuB
MRRIVSVWFPEFSIDRFKRQLRVLYPGRAQSLLDDRLAFAFTVKDGPALRIKAANRAANAAGVQAGMGLADAFAVLPSLQTRPFEPERDKKTLHGLARWAVRYAPLTAVDGDDGLLLDVTGASHLVGGDQDLLKDLTQHLKANGFAARAAMAPTPGAAFALARFGPPVCVCVCGSLAELENMLSPLPVEALRLRPEENRLLRRFGLKTIAAVASLPRAAVARRFSSSTKGETVLARLDHVFGRVADPIAAHHPDKIFDSRIVFAEPCLSEGGLSATLITLLERLCQTLEAARLGARALTLTLTRVDTHAISRTVETARASRTVHHLAKLFAPKLEHVEAGFGIDAMVLTATRVEPLATTQNHLSVAPSQSLKLQDDARLPELVDRLANRLGADNLFVTRAVESHLPERVEKTAHPLMSRTSDPEAAAVRTPQRPLRLFDVAHRIEVITMPPDVRPKSFRWRRVQHCVIAVRGPERILSEWWRQAHGADVTRDYYDVEDSAGHRFWIFHQTQAALEGEAQSSENNSWFLHGVFA